jgi:hypothetical protein
LAITTLFDPEDYINTSTDIIQQFIQTYIPSSDIEITTEKPFLDESTQLTIPIIYIENMISLSKKSNLLGKRINKDICGEFRDISFIFWIIISDDLGGSRKSREIAAAIENIFLNKASDLLKAGLKNPHMMSYKPVDKDASLQLYGGRLMFEAKVLVYY